MGTKDSRKRRGGWFWNRKGGRGDENDELVCGPAYVSFVGQDVEEFATVRQPGRYRWPVLPDINRHHVPLHNVNPLLSESVPFECVGIPGQTVRSVPSAEPPREVNVEKQLFSPTTTTGPISPTSIALRDLYEVVLRSGDIGPTAGRVEERVPLVGVGSGVLSANRSTSGRKRKGHVRQGSESHDEVTRLLDLKLEVRNPSVGEGRLGLREGGVGLGTEDEEDYMPLPTPTRVQFSVGDPPSSRSWKARAKDKSNPQYLPFSSSKDVLPPHPKQIMSPPLESQFYFLPLPTTAEPSDMRNGPVLGLVSSPVRVRGSVRPKVSNTREKCGERNDHGAQNPSKVLDDGPNNRDHATTSPLRTAPGQVENERRDTSSRRNSARKGKRKLVKANPATKSSTMN